MILQGVLVRFLSRSYKISWTLDLGCFRSLWCVCKEQTSVCWANVCFSSISIAVLLVLSTFSTSSVSLRKFPWAAESRASKLSSNLFRVIVYSFFCWVNSSWNRTASMISFRSCSEPFGTNSALFKIGPFFAHHGRQQLLFKAVLGDGEVDQSGLRLQLWFVVRVRQLSLQNQSIIKNIFVPDLQRTWANEKPQKDTVFKDSNCSKSLKQKTSKKITLTFNIIVYQFLWSGPK